MPARPPPDHRAPASQLDAALAEMPAEARARTQWYRNCRASGRFDREVLRTAFWGAAAATGGSLPEPEDEYLRAVQPGWMWVRIAANSRHNYVTSGYALNLSNPHLGVGPADWHQSCWTTPLQGTHPRARDSIAAVHNPTRQHSYYAETWTALADRGIFDARHALRELGHPAGMRSQPVWAAEHPRAIVDRAWHALRCGMDVALHVTPYTVARWLWTDAQFVELDALAGAVEQRLGGADGWREWRACLSPAAGWTDAALHLPSGGAGDAPAY